MSHLFNLGLIFYEQIMLTFTLINNSSYRITWNGTLEPSTNKYMIECQDVECIYDRRISRLREWYEQKIIYIASEKNNVNILFYGCYLLEQEKKIISMMPDKISEVHLTDCAYANFFSKPKYYRAIREFMKVIMQLNPTIRVYLHMNPQSLTDANDFYFSRRFDIVAGIDIDYKIAGSVVFGQNRVTIKKIAKHALKINGMLYVSQNFSDQVDMCCYKIKSKSNVGTIGMTETDDFVKEKYYHKYWYMNYVGRHIPTFHIFCFLSHLFFTKKYSWLCVPACVYHGLEILYSLVDSQRIYHKQRIHRLNHFCHKN